jgi:hypothetical protein
MKRFVGSDAGLAVTMGVATVAVVAIIGASAGATYLIAVGFLTIAILWRRFHEPPPEDLDA